MRAKLFGLLLLAGLGSACTNPVQPDPFSEQDHVCFEKGMMTPFIPGAPLPFDGSVTWEAYGNRGWIYPGCSSAWDKISAGGR